MDRELCSEFQPLNLDVDRTSGEWVQSPAFGIANYRYLVPTQSNILVSQVDIDLAGYNQQDLTLFFRNSFEQTGGKYVASWFVADDGGGVPNPPLSEFQTLLQEWTLVSSVPLSDEELYGHLAYPAGFLVPGLAAPLPGLEFGTFDRSQIIHGRNLVHGLSPNIGSTAFSTIGNGNGIYLVADDQYFSSLEPTAADRLYCYRVIGLPVPAYDPSVETGLTSVSVPPKRILLTCTSAKEEDLDYMMRLKRSYELANQQGFGDVL